MTELAMNGDPGLAQRFRRAQWRMLGAVMLCYLFFYTGRHNFGFAIAGIIQEFQLTSTQIGWASTGMLWAYGLGQLINGNLADRYGARRMMTLGAVLSVVMNWATSFAPTFTVLVILWALNGYCQSLGFAPGSRLISNWWPRQERGKAFGFYIFAAGCSTILTFLLSIILLQNGLDWRWLMRLPVLLLLVAAVAFFFIVREKPEDLGFAPLVEEKPQSTSSEDTTRPGHRYLHVFRNGRFLIACLAIGFQSVARYGLLFWAPYHYLGKSWKKDDGTAWIALALPIGMALGALFVGQVSDRVFRSNRSIPIALSMTLAGIVAALMWFLPDASLGLSLVLMFLAGFFVYGPASSFWAMCPDLLGRSFAGTGVGVMNFFAYFMAGIAEPMIGAMIEMTGDTAVVFGLTAIVSWTCAVIVLFVRK